MESTAKSDSAARRWKAATAAGIDGWRKPFVRVNTRTRVSVAFGEVVVAGAAGAVAVGAAVVGAGERVALGEVVVMAVGREPPQAAQNNATTSRYEYGRFV